MRSFLQQIFYPREKYNREINNIEWDKGGEKKNLDKQSTLN